MGPNERGWDEKTKNILAYSKGIGETIREMGNPVGPWGVRSEIETLTGAYMNVGRGHVVTNVYLESCARKGLGICFVGECWGAKTGLGTQSYPEYDMLGSATKGMKVVTFVRTDLVDRVELVGATARAVVVEVSGCRIRGVYGQCGDRIHAMQDWLGSLAGWIRRVDWVLLGDWNSHHHTWSLDGRLGPGGRFLGA